MKATTITRTIFTTTIRGAIVTVENGEVKTKPLPPITIVDTKPVKEKDQIKILNAKYKEYPTVIKLETEYQEVVHSISLENFILNSKVTSMSPTTYS